MLVCVLSPPYVHSHTQLYLLLVRFKILAVFMIFGINSKMRIYALSSVIFVTMM